MILIGILFIWAVVVVFGRGLIYAIKKLLPINLGQLVLISLIRALFYAPAAPFGIMMVPSVVYIVLVSTNYPPNIVFNPSLFIFSGIVFLGSLFLGIANNAHKPNAEAKPA